MPRVVTLPCLYHGPRGRVGFDLHFKVAEDGRMLVELPDGNQLRLEPEQLERLRDESQLARRMSQLRRGVESLLSRL